MIDTDETWNSAEHFPSFYSNTSQWRGWGPWELGNAHSLTQNEFLQWLWGFCCERWEISQPFFGILLLFMSTKPGQGISAWDLPVKHLWSIQTCFRNLIFSIHHPFLETFHRNVLNIMTVLTSINTGQYFLSWSKLLKCCYSISQEASCRELLGWEQMSSLPTRSKWKTSATKGKEREQQWYVDILVVAEWCFIAYSWRRLWTVQDALGYPGAKPRPQVSCDLCFIFTVNPILGLHQSLSNISNWKSVIIGWRQWPARMDAWLPMSNSPRRGWKSFILLGRGWILKLIIVMHSQK